MDRRRSFRRLLAVGALIAATLLAMPVGGAGAAGSATVDPVTTPVRPGDVIPVTGDGWPAGQMVSASICGNNGVNGSANCALSEASTFPITRDGTLAGRVYVTTPPAPCPCVLKVVAMGATAQKQTPLQIEGVPWSDEVAATTIPEAPDQTPPETSTPPEPTLAIESVTIEDTSGRSSLFGAPAGRLLRLTVANNGELPVKGARLSLRYGKGSPDMVVETPEVPTIGAGESVTVEVAFDLGTLAFGTYTVSGEVGVVGNRVPFEGETTQWPWGLLVVGVVLLQLLVLWILRRNRRIRRQREAELAAASAESDAAEPMPVPVSTTAVAVADPVAGTDADLVAGTDADPVAGTDVDPVHGDGLGTHVAVADPVVESVGTPSAPATTDTAPAVRPPTHDRLEGPVIAAPWH